MIYYQIWWLLAIKAVDEHVSAMLMDCSQPHSWLEWRLLMALASIACHFALL